MEKTLFQKIPIDCANDHTTETMRAVQDMFGASLSQLDVQAFTQPCVIKWLIVLSPVFTLKQWTGCKTFTVAVIPKDEFCIAWDTVRDVSC